MIGIYKIISPNSRIYIGQSINIIKRFYDYKYINNTKKQVKLHRSFLKYGIKNHIFEIICECKISELNEKERYYQDLYNVLKNGLNCKLTTTSSRSGKISYETLVKMQGRKNTAEHFKKLILDNSTGIFYLGVKEASIVYDLNTGTLSARLCGRMINNTNFIYV
jgi:group I intron endonuclease